MTEDELTQLVRTNRLRKWRAPSPNEPISEVPITYFLQAVEDGPVKVGQSTKPNLAEHISRVQDKFPFDLICRLVIQGDHVALFRRLFNVDLMREGWFGGDVFRNASWFPSRQNYLLEQVSTVTRAGGADRACTDGAHVTSSLRSDVDCGVGSMDVSREESKSTAIFDDEIENLYDRYLEVLARYGPNDHHPSPTRVLPRPNDRVSKLLGKALKEAPLATCLQAIEGFYTYQTHRGVGGKGIESIFKTFRGTGSLLERINFFASFATGSDEPSIGRAVLDLPGVRSRLEDARREFRAALDLPDNPGYQRRAAETERWLMDLGLQVNFLDDRRFEIVPVMSPRPLFHER